MQGFVLHDASSSFVVDFASVPYSILAQAYLLKIVLVLLAELAPFAESCPIRVVLLLVAFVLVAFLALHIFVSRLVERTQLEP